MSERSAELLVEDILIAAEKILAYTKGLDYNSFTSDEKTVDAVVRNFEIIGEAAKRMPGSYVQLHNEIPWRRIAGFRNRIIHEYFGIDYEIVWKIITDNIPELVGQLRK